MKQSPPICQITKALFRPHRPALQPTPSGDDRLRGAIAWFVSLAVAWTTTLGATVYEVNSHADFSDASPGDGVCSGVETPPTCSLRAAIQEANASPGPDAVVIPAGHYELLQEGDSEDLCGSGDLDVLDDLELLGAGESTTILDGAALDRVFDIGPDGSLVSVSFRDLTIANGRSVSGTGSGGCVRIGETAALALERVTVSGCVCRFEGCGILALGDLSGHDVSFIGNGGQDAPHGHSSGGALAVFSAGVNVDLERCLFEGNAASNGGAMWTTSSDDDRARVRLAQCSLVDNLARQFGGAVLANQHTDFEITDTTFSGNTAGAGGAIGNDGGCTFDIRGSTITNNHATSLGGGIAEVHFHPQFIGLTNTILAGNTADSFAPDCQLRMHSSGGTILGDSTDCEVDPGPGDIVDVDPQLLPAVRIGLRNWVHVPRSTSPAIDAGIDATCTPTDQLGSPRPLDGDGDAVPQCDIGAIETGGLVFADSFEDGTSDRWSDVLP